MRVLLDALSIVQRHVGSRAAVAGKTMEPLKLCHQRAGTQNFLLQIGMGETDIVRKMIHQLQISRIIQKKLLSDLTTIYFLNGRIYIL